MPNAENETRKFVTKIKEHILSHIARIWLFVAFVVITSGSLLICLLGPRISSGKLVALTFIMTVLTLAFAFVQGKIFPVNEDLETSDIDMLRMTIASMIVPLYFLFVLIAQVIAWIKSSAEPYLLLFLTALALVLILVIKKARPQPSKQLKTKGIRIFYAATLSALGTIAVVIGIDENNSLPKENFIEIFCAIAFLVIVMALMLGYLTQEPKVFFSKLVKGGAKFNRKNLAIVTGVALPWFLLWIVTSSLIPFTICCAIISIFVLSIWQTWAVEETSKWVFD